MAEGGILYTNILVCEAVGDNPGHQSDPGVATTGGEAILHCDWSMWPSNITTILFWSIACWDNIYFLRANLRTIKELSW